MERKKTTSRSLKHYQSERQYKQDLEMWRRNIGRFNVLVFGFVSSFSVRSRGTTERLVSSKIGTIPHATTTAPEAGAVRAFLQQSP